MRYGERRSKNEERGGEGESNGESNGEERTKMNKVNEY